MFSGTEAGLKGRRRLMGFMNSLNFLSQKGTTTKEDDQMVKNLKHSWLKYVQEIRQMLFPVPRSLGKENI